MVVVSVPGALHLRTVGTGEGGEFLNVNILRSRMGINSRRREKRIHVRRQLPQALPEHLPALAKGGGRYAFEIGDARVAIWSRQRFDPDQ